MTLNNTVYEIFAAKTKESENAAAVTSRDKNLTRKELLILAGRIAGMIPDDAKRVGIVMNHSPEMIAALFAVLKKGAAYVPAEPFFPDDRIRFMLTDGGVEYVITCPEYVSRFEGMNVITVSGNIFNRDESDDEIYSCDVTEDDLAYILYTSGSTGNPKGVAVTNRNVCHYVRAFADEFHPGEDDVMLQYSVCSFDIFVEEVFTTLLNGAMLAIPSEEDKKDVRSLMNFVKEFGVTQISGFPYLLLEMNHLPEIPKSLRLLISGGDVIRESYVTNLVDRVEVYNTYGPSETTVCASYYNCSKGKALADGTYPVGRPVKGMQIKICDENMNELPGGETGELCIIGDGVSAGYIGDRKVENQAFIHQPDGSVIYRSGDLGYYLPDGNIAFLHRKDTQVMILGRRVETTEVESVLIKCPEIEKAVVKAYTDEQHLSYLVAYIVTNNNNAPLSTIRKEMARFLPAYMIPEYFVKLNDMPLNANGKVDSKALPFIMKEGVVA